MVASDKPPRAFVSAGAVAHSLAAGRAPRDPLGLVGVDVTDAEAVAVRRFGHLLFEMAAGARAAARARQVVTSVGARRL